MASTAISSVLIVMAPTQAAPSSSPLHRTPAPWILHCAMGSSKKRKIGLGSCRFSRIGTRPQKILDHSACLKRWVDLLDRDPKAILS